MNEQAQQVAAQRNTLAAQVKQLLDRHKAELKPLADALEQHDNWLIEYAKQVGSKSLEINGVEIERKDREEYAIENWQQLWDWLRPSELGYTYLSKKVLKEAMREFEDKHGQLPPGTKKTEWQEYKIKTA